MTAASNALDMNVTRTNRVLVSLPNTAIQYNQRKKKLVGQKLRSKALHMGE
jgi:hypothetical protein